MLFSISQTALNGSEALLNCLDAIMGRVEDTVHELQIIDADILDESAWYKSSRPERRKLLEEIASANLRSSTKTAGPHFRKINIVDLAGAENARQIANTPVQLLLENEYSDGALVEAAIKALANPETHRLFFGSPAQLAIPAIILDSRGGHGELRKLVDKKIFESKRNGRPSRCIVVTDSDGEFVGEVKEHALNIRSLCQQNNIPCPPLNKRTAENYIPDEILDAWSDGVQNTSRREMVDALKKLNENQRDYIHMDNGNKSPWNKGNVDSENLFHDVDDVDFEYLKNARLKGKGDTMTIYALTEHASLLNSTSFQNRDKNGDLMKLVRDVEDEL